jgi:hypothetical protein
MSTSVVVAVALLCILILIVTETQFKKQQSISIFDLKELNELPYELKRIVKPAVLTNMKLFKQNWSKFENEQRDIIIQAMSHMFVPPEPPLQSKRPAPSVVIKPNPKVSNESGIKPGFLLSDGIDKTQKENSKNKKQNKIVTLSDVGGSDDDTRSGDD